MKNISLNHGSLFSGIGGFDLASEWMGWNNVFHCEFNSFAQQVLKYYWPNAISYEDITKTDFSIWRGKIDILTGGFPCQPYSLAGYRKGKEDNRHLWPEMFRAIKEISPSYIVGENVYGLVNWNGGLVFKEVQTDLESEGYQVQPVVLPACGVGAPHRRDRIWFVAYSDSSAERSPRESDWVVGKRSENNDEPEKWRKQTKQHKGCSNVLRADTYTYGKRQQRQRGGEQQINTEEERDWQKYRIIDDGRWPIESPVCNGNDGISSKLDGITFSKWRKESIKSGGNAIVPQVAYEIFKVIQKIENERYKY